MITMLKDYVTFYFIIGLVWFIIHRIKNGGSLMDSLLVMVGWPITLVLLALDSKERSAG